MGLLSSFTILLTMATFKHLNGGNVQSKRVIVENGYPAASATQAIEIEQPANSQIVGGHFRTLEAVTIANTGEVGISVGKTAGATDIFNGGTDVIADDVSGATSLPANFFLNFATATGMTASQFSTGDSASPLASDGYTEEARTVHITVSSDVTITLGTGETGKYEVQLDFKMLGSE